MPQKSNKEKPEDELRRLQSDFTRNSNEMDRLLARRKQLADMIGSYESTHSTASKQKKEMVFVTGSRLSRLRNQITNGKAPASSVRRKATMRSDTTVFFEQKLDDLRRVEAEISNFRRVRSNLNQRMNELLLQNPTWSGLSALKVRLARSETELANAIARRNQFEEMVRNYSEKMGQDSKDTFSVAQLKRRKKELNEARDEVNELHNETLGLRGRIKFIQAKHPIRTFFSGIGEKTRFKK